MYPRNDRWYGNTVDLFDSLLVILLDHKGHSLRLDAPFLDGNSFVVCRDCNSRILSGSSSLVENVFVEFLQH
jgi:hypothetical protein